MNYFLFSCHENKSEIRRKNKKKKVLILQERKGSHGDRQQNLMNRCPCETPSRASLLKITINRSGKLMKASRFLILSSEKKKKKK